MSGVEIVGIIAATAAVITAFDNGGAILKRLNKKRKKPLPSQLEEKVTEAPVQILKKTKRGLDRFGGQFDSGDRDTIILLQSIIINLQNSFLERLRDANDGDEVDFSALIDNVDLVRSQTVGALNGLYQKLLQGGENAEAPLLMPSINPASTATIQPASRVQTLASSLASQSKETVATEENSVITAQELPSKAPRKTSLFRRSQHDRKSSRDDSTRSNDHKPVKPIGKFVSLAPPQPKRSSTGQVATRQHSIAGNHEHDITGGHEDLETTSPIDMVKPDPRRRQTCPSLVDTHTIVTKSSDSGYGSSRIVSMARSTSNDTSGSLELYDMNSTPKLTKGNAFHGLCKGAVKLQNGDKAAIYVGRDYQYHSQSKVPLLSCTAWNCQFKGHKVPQVIWNEVFFDPGRGLKYRWAFLAKSHIRQSVPLNRQYLYSCLFCIFMGYKSPVMLEEKYLDHICKEHRGTVMNSVVLYKTFCVSDHIASDREEFDINLFPLTAKEQNDRRLVDFRNSTAAPEGLMDVDAYLKSFEDLKVYDDSK